MGAHVSTLRRLDDLLDLLGPGPWRRSEVLAAGWSRSSIDHAVTAGHLLRPRRGLLELPDRPRRSDQLPMPYDVRVARMRALAPGLAPGAVFSHDSAAHVHRLWTPGTPQPLIHVTVPGGRERTNAGLTVHSSELPPAFVIERAGVKVTTIARTAVDLGIRGDLPAALVAADSALRLLVLEEWPGGERDLREGRVPAHILETARATLETAALAVRGWPGSGTVAAAIAAADPRSESAFESWSRGWILVVGLPRPEINRRVFGASGRTYYGDFVWDEQRLIGEVDGLGKYGTTAAEARRAMRAERERQADLEGAGWRLRRWMPGDSGAAIVGRLGRALYLDPAVIRGAARRGA